MNLGVVTARVLMAVALRRCARAAQGRCAYHARARAGPVRRDDVGARDRVLREALADVVKVELGKRTLRTMACIRRIGGMPSGGAEREIRAKAPRAEQNASQAVMTGSRVMLQAACKMESFPPRLALS